MKKITFLIILFLSFLGSTEKAFTQSTDDLETETNGTTSFSDGGKTFNVTNSMKVINAAGFGANSSNYYLDNTSNQALSQKFSIKTSDASSFVIKTLDLYLSSQLNGNNPTNDGSITIRGKLSGATVYTITKSNGFPTNFSGDNGFSNINFASAGAADYSSTAIDEVELELGGSFEYIAVDDFHWDAGVACTNSTLTSSTASTNNVCPNTTVSLTANGLSLGTGATFNWYTGSGGTGTNLGSSNSLSVSPASTTTYYAYVTGTCNTIEQSITVTVDQTLSTLTSATASTNNVCPNTAVTLTANGVTTGTGATLTWYTGSGGAGSNLGTGSTKSVSPTTTTTYYARLAGTCNTVEQSITVVVDQTLSTLTSATASTNNVCPGTMVSLSITGGTAGTGATYGWYTGSGGTGTSLGSSIPLNVSPTSTTTYYFYITGNCNTLEESITVTVDQTASTLTSATANTNNIYPNTAVTLTANGVTSGSGAALTWYDGANGTGNNLGTGGTKSVSPATTTTYYARLEGTCNTVEQSITVTVDNTPPTLTSSVPTDGATGIATNGNIVLTFDKNIAFGTGNIQVIDVTDGSNSFIIDAASPGGEASISGAVLTINPSADLDGLSNYTIQIAATAIDDASGNSFAGITNNTTLDFTTADETNPTLASSSPTDGATGITSNGNIVLTFNENIAFGTGNIQVIDVTDGSNSFTIDVASPGSEASISGAVLTINPSADLDGLSNYTIQIAATAIDDASGNSFAGITNNTTLDFTTQTGFVVVESGGATSTNENGTTDTFTVALNSQPNSNVVIDVSSGDLTEGTVDKSTLTFTTANWNIAQTVTVTGLDDSFIDGSPSYNVTLSINAALTDDAFDGLANQTVSVNNFDNEITAAVAGADQNVCGTSTILGGNTPNAGLNESGTWSIITGAGGTLVSTSSPTSGFSGAVNTAYTLRWTINNGGVSQSTDDVVITLFDSPDVANAGPNQNISGTTTLAANTVSGLNATATWTQLAGPGVVTFGDANSNTSSATVTVVGNYTFRWTISNGVCPVSSDDVNVIFNAEAPTVVTNDATGIAANQATLTGSVSSNGGAVITERGILLVKTSVNLNPKIDDGNLYAHIKVTNLSYALNYQPDGLDTNIKYSYVAYAKNSIGISYGAVKTFTTQKNNQSITFDAISNKTYGDSSFNLAATSSSGLTVTYISSNTTAATVSGNTITIVGAGSTNITASQVGNTNYNAASNMVQELTIDKAILTATADDKSREYGEANPIFTITYAGFKGTDTVSNIDTAPTVSSTAVATTNAGSAIITVSGGNDINYSIAKVDGALTIGKAALTANAVYKTKIYGDANPTFDILYTGFKNGETAVVLDTAPIASCTATTSTNVGSETIDVSIGSDTNYTINSISGILNIDKATITATAENKLRDYGDANPVFTIAYVGFKNGDTATDIDTAPTVSTTATSTTNVGTATITLSGGTDNNYTVTSNNGTLTINKATLIVAAKNTTFEYGDNFTIGFEYGAFKNGEDASVLDAGAYVYIVGSAPYNVGTYTIKPDAVGDNNYIPSYVHGTLTVNKATLNVTADDKSKTYGDANPAFTISYSGFKGSDSESDINTAPTATSTATATTDVGTATINTSTGSDNNYTIVSVDGTLAIGKATLTATADDKTKEYGDANPAFTISYSGFKGSDSESDIDTAPTATSTATAATDVGTATISTSTGKDNNYTIVSVVGTLTIDKATLTATADDKTKVFGTANPALTITYNGFKGSDSVADIDTAPIASSTATATTVAGTSPIDMSAGVDNNYTIVSVNGTLTILVDTDGDGVADVNDSDDDNDGIPDVDDNSPLIPNKDQKDTDGDGVADVEEDCDNDGIINYYDTDVASCQEPILKKKTYGFSPNGDGINDGWVVEDIELFPNNVVQVFNRSGKVVFKMKGYDNSFEGTFKGKKLPVGPYLYIIDLGNGSKPTKGWMYINY